MVTKHFELSLAVVQLSALTRSLIEQNQQLAMGNKAALERIVELENKFEQKLAQVKLLSEELKEVYDRKDKLVDQLQHEIAELTDKYLKLEHRLDRQAKQDQEDARKWRALQEEWQRDAEESYFKSLYESELPTITDIQVCPSCGEQQLVPTGHDVFECHYCGGSFDLGFEL